MFTPPCHCFTLHSPSSKPVGHLLACATVKGVTEATHADKGIYIRSGIVVIQNGTTVPDGTVI